MKYTEYALVQAVGGLKTGQRQIDSILWVWETVPALNETVTLKELEAALMVVRKAKIAAQVLINIEMDEDNDDDNNYNNS